MYTATITKSGQVTLPKELRDYLGVKIGGKIFFEKTKTGVIIQRRLSDEELLERIKEIHKKHEGFYGNLPDTVDAVRALRDGKIETIIREYKERYAA